MGGINSSGCDAPNSNFYCFDNTTIPPTPGTLLTSTAVLGWEVTLAAGGSWADYTTAFKIDWVGTQNNYSLVSEAIPINTTCPDCVITTQIVDAPEPGTLSILGSALAMVGGMVWWRRRRGGRKALPQGLIIRA